MRYLFNWLFFNTYFCSYWVYWVTSLVRYDSLLLLIYPIRIIFIINDCNMGLLIECPLFFYHLVQYKNITCRSSFLKTILFVRHSGVGYYLEPFTNNILECTDRLHSTSWYLCSYYIYFDLLFWMSIQLEQFANLLGLHPDEGMYFRSWTFHVYIVRTCTTIGLTALYFPQYF